MPLQGGPMERALLVTVAALGAAGMAQAQQPPRMLLQTDLAGVPGQELIIQAVDIGPGGATPWHSHPGGHEIAYVLEGQTAAEFKDAPARSAKAGELIHIAPDLPHLGRNPSNTDMLKLLVIRIKDKQQPILVPLK